MPANIITKKAGTTASDLSITTDVIILQLFLFQILIWRPPIISRFDASALPNDYNQWNFAG